MKINASKALMRNTPSKTPVNTNLSSNRAPFGVKLRGRTFEDSTYRNTFNGKESDVETETQDYGMRIYDNDLGIFQSVDLITKKYPELSPYQFSSNSPISGVDLDGLEYYYSANGYFIGKIGDNTSVRVVKAGEMKRATAFVNAANQPDATAYPAQAANAISTDIGMTNDELNMRATLATLKQSEAGSSNPPLDYNKWNEFDNFTEKTYEEDPAAYEEHPGANQNSKSPKGRTSAGAYQFMQRYYEGDDFSPATQDKEAVKLMGTKGRAAAKSGVIATIKTALSGKWTSLEHWTEKKLEKVFRKNIADELNNKSKIAAPKGELTKEN